MTEIVSNSEKAKMVPEKSLVLWDILYFSTTQVDKMTRSKSSIVKPSQKRHDPGLKPKRSTVKFLPIIFVAASASYTIFFSTRNINIKTVFNNGAGDFDAALRGVPQTNWMHSIMGPQSDDDDVLANKASELAMLKLQPHVKDNANAAMDDDDDDDDDDDVATSPPALLPLCMDNSFFGGTNNRIISLARLLSKVSQERQGRKVGLSKEWSDWYKLHFDDREEIIFEHYPDNPCVQNFTGERAFRNKAPLSPGLLMLLPKKEFRDEADRIIATWDHGNEFVSAHRRHLEGGCYIRAICEIKRQRKCLKHRTPTGNCSSVTRIAMCDMIYPHIVNPTKQSVVLFTDGQIPELDETFPNRFNASMASHFLVEMMLMTKSSTHWGNPSSTVDVVVYHWRKGRSMMPEDCTDTFINYK